MIGGRTSLSVAFTPVSGLLLLLPAFLGSLTVFDDFVDLADDVLVVRQEVSIFVDRRVSRRHVRPIDVGNIRERDETFAVWSVDLFYWPVPLEPGLAAFGTFGDLWGLVGICVHVWPGIAHKCRCPWLVSVGKGGRFGDIPGKVYNERTPKGQASATDHTHKAQNTKGGRPTQLRLGVTHR